MHLGYNQDEGGSTPSAPTKKLKYSKETFVAAVEKSSSVLDILRKLGVSHRGKASYDLVRAHAQHYGIELPTYQRRIPSGRRTKIILCLNPDLPTRVPGSILRRELQNTGIEYECKACGLGPNWNGKHITLDVDHINSDWRDNRVTNLQFLCPNCHSQKTRPSKLHKECQSCGNPIFTRPEVHLCHSCRSSKAGKASNSKHPQPSIGKWPGLATLRRWFESKTNVEIARLVGVSESAVRKRRRRHV